MRGIQATPVALLSCSGQVRCFAYLGNPMTRTRPTPALDRIAVGDLHGAAGLLEAALSESPNNTHARALLHSLRLAPAEHHPSTQWQNLVFRAKLPDLIGKSVSEMLNALRLDVLQSASLAWHQGEDAVTQRGWKTEPVQINARDHSLPLTGFITAAMRAAASNPHTAATISIASFARNFDLQWWALALPPGGYERAHIHEADLSGVLYLAVPERATDSDEGALNFLSKSPELPTIDVPDTKYTILPEAGDIVLFPSYLWHCTTPFSARSLRVCIAFDLTFSEST